MATRPNPNQLVVEGVEDQYALVSLLGKWIKWGRKRPDWPVEVHEVAGISNILDRDKINARLKSSGLMRLGFVMDADDSCASRWISLYNFLSPHFPNIPDELPTSGVVYKSESGFRVGAWIMPDNGSDGMLESFLSKVVPSSDRLLFEHAQVSVNSAKDLGATFKELHKDKAVIHNYLSLVDPPGMGLGNAVLNSLLDGRSQEAAPFVKWFKDLFEL